MNFKVYLESKGYSQSSIESYYWSFTHYLNWCEEEKREAEYVDHNGLLHYLKYLQKRNISQSSIQSYLHSINHYHQWLQQQDASHQNPIPLLGIQSGKKKKLHHLLDRQELDTLYENYPYDPNEEKEEIKLLHHRNKVLIGILVNQGIASPEISRLEMSHLDLKKGILQIERSRKSNERVLPLVSYQMYDLMEYVHQTRVSLLAITEKESSQLFIGTGVKDNSKHLIHSLVTQLKRVNPRINNLAQIRASVITHWIRNYNLREVQYRAGHRYISSTERYKLNDIESMREGINKFHPL